MNEKPNRPPDVSTPIQLPTEEALLELDSISYSHDDRAVRLLAAIVARLCPAVEAIGRALPSVARGDFVSLDPDVEGKGPK